MLYPLTLYDFFLLFLFSSKQNHKKRQRVHEITIMDAPPSSSGSRDLSFFFFFCRISEFLIRVQMTKGMILDTSIWFVDCFFGWLILEDKHIENMFCFALFSGFFIIYDYENGMRKSEVKSDLRHLSNWDSLTSLPNRKRLHRELLDIKDMKSNMK